jgi:hypothetical protein
MRSEILKTRSAFIDTALYESEGKNGPDFARRSPVPSGRQERALALLLPFLNGVGVVYGWQSWFSKKKT